MTSTAQQNGLAARMLEYIQQRRDEKLNSIKDPDKRAKEEAKYDPATWLSAKAGTAKSVAKAIEQSFSDVTHVAKYIHGDSKASSVSATVAQEADMETDGYISTHSVSTLTCDTACNAAALPIKPFLLLEHDGHTLIDVLRRGDVSPFLTIAPNETIAQGWASAFVSAFDAMEPTAHKFSKQCYWPVQSDEYHILIPLYATSLAHATHATIRHAYRSGEAKEARDARRKEEYSELEVTNYPNLAVQRFGGDNQQNISYLNSQRHGEVYLFPCEPPKRDRKLTPPFNTGSIFFQRLERRLYREHIQPLRDFLHRVLHKNNNDEIKRERAYRLDRMIDDILVYAASIQNLPPGWSAKQDCRLPLAERYWLDPGRSEIDEEFRAQRDATDWSAEVAKDFAIWLSRKLESDRLAFGADEQRDLRNLMEEELKGL